jgi:uncharacterized membrane protein
MADRLSGGLAGRTAGAARREPTGGRRMSRTAAGRIAGLPLPAWLIALSIVPLLGGMARLLQLTSGDAPAPQDLRFAVAPLPVTLHIVAATFYCVVGAFQFDSGLRGHWPVLHRVLGRVTVACGLVVGLTGLWMTLASEIPSGLQGDLLRVARVVVAASMVASLVLGVIAIWAGQVRSHLAWMARAYALAQGAGTQALLLLPPTLAFGEVTGLARDLAMTAAWLMNLWIVEWVLAHAAQAPAARLAVGTRSQA